VEANLPHPSDTAVIMYTSGSTGMPKVCSNPSVSHHYSDCACLSEINISC
jgi:acyl-coenzyme A synthetase/AMP-(fatty) acid ligase